MPKPWSFRDRRSAPDFGPHEYQDRPLRAAQELGQPLGLFRGRHVLDLVRDRARGTARRADLHVLRLAHDLVQQLHHVVRHRRREEQRLPLARVRQRRRDPLDVGPEAHVHHPIRLVEHEGIDAREVDGVAALMIHQPPGRGDDDVDASLEGAFLRAHLDAAVDGDAREIGVIGEALHVVFDLHAELTRRREDQHAREAAFRGPFGPRLEDAVQDRQHEGHGLAGARVGAADHVMPLQRDRNHRALDRRRLQEAADLDPFEQRRLEAERVERNRLRIVGGLRPIRALRFVRRVELRAARRMRLRRASTATASPSTGPCRLG